MEANKLAVDINKTREFMFHQFGVVKLEQGIKLLDQNDFGVSWKMVHLALT